MADAGATDHHLSSSSSCSASKLPFHEYVVKSKVVKNRAYIRAFWLIRIALCTFYLTWRIHNTFFNNNSTTSQHSHNLTLTLIITRLAVFCEVCMGLHSSLNILVRSFIVQREVYPERLESAISEANEELRNELQKPVDVFVTTADPVREPPLVTMNTVLSVLALDYPQGKLACYVSDDGGCLLTLWSLRQTHVFARHWLAFCRKFHVSGPLAPAAYFRRKKSIEDAMNRGFLQEWNEIKYEYQIFDARLAKMTQKYKDNPIEATELILSELEATLPGRNYTTLNDNACSHAPYCEVLEDKKSGELPTLVYIAREKNPQHKHHYKAGAMNALLRVSGVYTNYPYIINLDCDMYANRADVIKLAMCFFNDPKVNAQNAFVQFPQEFEANNDEDGESSKSMKAVMEVFLRGMDGVQGPVFCGTGCVHKRTSLYGRSPKYNMSNEFDNVIMGPSPRFNLCSQNIQSSTKDENMLLDGEEFIQEAMSLIGSTYEHRTSWGDKVGLVYGSTTEDLITGLKIHGRGWRTIMCTPQCPAFLGGFPTVSEEMLTTRKRWCVGMLEVLFGKNSPLMVKNTPHLSLCQRIIYTQALSYPLPSIPIFLYGVLSSLSLLFGTPMFPKTNNSLYKILGPILVVWIYWCGYFENLLVDVTLEEWWGSERMEGLVSMSSSLFAIFEVMKKILGLSETTFVVTRKDHKPLRGDNQKIVADEFQGFSIHSNSPLFIPPTLLVIINTMGVVTFGIRKVLTTSFGSSPYNTLDSPLYLELISSFWVLYILKPILKGFYLWCCCKKGPLSLHSSIVRRALFCILLLLSFILVMT